MNDSIWKRRLELERAEHKERESLLGPLQEKYRPLYEALKAECEARGHEWLFQTVNVGGQAIYACNYCRKTRVEK